MKTKNRQMSFAAMTQIDERQKSWNITQTKKRKVPNLLSGYMVISRIRDITAAIYILWILLNNSCIFCQDQLQHIISES
jgi:hypothetical protein